MNSARPLYKFLSRKKGDVADLVTQAQIHQKQARSLANLLDPALRGHVRLANIRTNTLILLADSAAWATRARLFTPALLQKLRNNSHIFGKIEKIELKIRPHAESAPPPPPPARKLSPAAAACLRSAAAGIDDPELKAALDQLARRADNKY